MRPASIQYSAGLPLNKKAVAMMANAQTSDQTMAVVTSFLELGIIVSTVAWLCQPSPVKSNGVTTLFFPCATRKLSAPEILQAFPSWFSTNDLQLKTLFPRAGGGRVRPKKLRAQPVFSLLRPLTEP